MGKHSQGGQPRILPAIVRVLMASGLTFRSQPGNAGVIEVHLPGQPLAQGLAEGAHTAMTSRQDQTRGFICPASLADEMIYPQSSKAANADTAEKLQTRQTT